jgi:uncharacterized RDD family membrane protein YckC
VFCVKCGTQVADNARFCRACGAELRATQQPESVVSAVVPAAQSAPAAPSVQPDADAPRYAGFWRRVFAALVDGLLLALAWTVASAFFELAAAGWLAGREFAPDGHDLLGALSVISAGRSALGTVMFLLYFALPEVTPFGATLGKRLLGMRVTKLDGTRVGIFRSIARNLLKGLSAVLLMIGFAMAGFTKRKQALHDMLTGTLVVRR